MRVSTRRTTMAGTNPTNRDGRTDGSQTERPAARNGGTERTNHDNRFTQAAQSGQTNLDFNSRTSHDSHPASPKRAGVPTLDPRAKLALLLLANLMLFFHVALPTQMAMVMLFLLPILAAGRIGMAVRFAALYAVLTAIGLLVPTSVNPWLDFVAMLATGVTMMLPCFITGAYAFSTTPVSAFVCAMRRMRVPEAIVVPCVVVLRFFPTIREDYRRIREAMALRGIASGGAALLRHPAQSLEYVLVPLLMNAANVAQDLSVAALTRGLGRPGPHTSRTDIRMTWVDWGYMAVCALPLILDIAGVTR